jgi:hypothetical protein
MWATFVRPGWHNQITCRTSCEFPAIKSEEHAGGTPRSSETWTKRKPFDNRAIPNPGFINHKFADSSSGFRPRNVVLRSPFLRRTHYTFRFRLVLHLVSEIASASDSSLTKVVVAAPRRPPQRNRWPPDGCLGSYTCLPFRNRNRIVLGCEILSVRFQKMRLPNVQRKEKVLGCRTVAAGLWRGWV